MSSKRKTWPVLLARPPSRAVAGPWDWRRGSFAPLGAAATQRPGGRTGPCPMTASDGPGWHCHSTCLADKWQTRRRTDALFFTWSEETGSSCEGEGARGVAFISPHHPGHSYSTSAHSPPRTGRPCRPWSTFAHRGGTARPELTARTRAVCPAAWRLVTSGFAGPFSVAMCPRGGSRPWCVDVWSASGAPLGWDRSRASCQLKQRITGIRSF